MRPTSWAHTLFTCMNISHRDAAELPIPKPREQGRICYDPNEESHHVTTTRKEKGSYRVLPVYDTALEHHGAHLPGKLVA